MKPYTHFTLKERICLEEMRKAGKKISEIAKHMDRNKSTISRELKRNSNKQGLYNSWGAYSKSTVRRKKSVRKQRIEKDSEVYDYICEKLNLYWSPKLIAAMWNLAHPDENIAFATIYRAIKNKLFEGITAKTHLRRKGKKRYGKRSKFNTIQPEHTIHERSKEIEERKHCGHWEGDTIRGSVGKGGLLTLVDRKSRKLLAVKINDFSSDTLYKAVKYAFDGISPKSITFDNGSEFARWKDMERDLNTTIYFADPHSPWQRGSNENMNDVLRFFFPKGCNFIELSQKDIDCKVALINSRPRFCLDLHSPDEVFCCT